MKFNKWTLGLAAIGAVSLASAVQAEEKSNPVMTALSSTSISGYVDTAAVWRFGNNQAQGAYTPFSAPWVVPGSVGGNPTRTPLGAGYQNKADIFNLNVVGLTIEKPLDEAEWSAGYKAEFLFGPDAVGWNPSVNSFGINDMAIKEAYVTLRAPVGNGLDFKLGTFDCPHGYESFNSYKNPTWTRSYGWEIEPTQHTGALVSYRFSDVVAASAGIANTAGTGINARAFRAGLPAGTATSETEKTYMASLSLTAPESLGFLAGSTLTAGIINGLAGGGSDTTWIYVGGTMNTPAESLKLGIAYDQVLTDSTLVVQPRYAYAIAGYATWQATEKLKLVGRVDYAKGSAGVWYASGEVTGVGNGNPENRLLGVTAGIDYSLWENVITRLEFRWDKDLTSQHLLSSGAGPFGFDDRHNMFVALNVIYKF